MPYNFRAESVWGYGKGYSHPPIRNDAGPLSFYRFSPQHAVRASASGFDRAVGVAICGARCQGNIPMGWVYDSDDFALYGHGGNARAVEKGTMILLERTPRVLTGNAVGGPTKTGSRGQSRRFGSKHGPAEVVHPHRRAESGQRVEAPADEVSRAVEERRLAARRPADPARTAWNSLHWPPVSSY
jgi:hypothetical protein